MAALDNSLTVKAQYESGHCKTAWKKMHRKMAMHNFQSNLLCVFYFPVKKTVMEGTSFAKDLPYDTLFRTPSLWQEKWECHGRDNEEWEWMGGVLCACMCRQGEPWAVPWRSDQDPSQRCWRYSRITHPWVVFPLQAVSWREAWKRWPILEK